jgi:hypothetical protein
MAPQSPKTVGLPLNLEAYGEPALNEALHLVPHHSERRIDDR